MTIRGITVLDDTYNANPESLRAAVEVLRAAPCEGRRIAALGDMLELGEGAQGEHESAGEELRGLDEVWLAGAFAADFERGARRAGVKTIRKFSDSAQLGEALRAEARTLDLLLVKGSRGMKMERVLDALRRE